MKRNETKHGETKQLHTINSKKDLENLHRRPRPLKAIRSSIDRYFTLQSTMYFTFMLCILLGKSRVH